MQTELSFEQEDMLLEIALDKHHKKDPDFTLSEIIRNISYKQTQQNEHTSIQRNIVDKIITAHPEGITDIEICIITGFSRSSVNARRNEIKNIIPIGIAKYTDEYGNDHMNTMWGKTE